MSVIQHVGARSRKIESLSLAWATWREPVLKNRINNKKPLFSGIHLVPSVLQPNPDLSTLIHLLCSGNLTPIISRKVLPPSDLAKAPGAKELPFLQSFTVHSLSSFMHPCDPILAFYVTA
jgi:hypothetical protein